MSLFPFFKEIEGMRALIVGGGEVALRRADALLRSSARVTCIAPEFCEGMTELNAERIRRRIERQDLSGWDIVIAATDDRALNASVAEMAKSQGSEVSVADDPEAGTFLFPGVVRRGGMIIAISSGGASPSASKYVRERIESVIPENFESVLESMEIARRLAKTAVSDQKARADVLRKTFDWCLQSEAQPDEAELMSMIRHFGGAELD